MPPERKANQVGVSSPTYNMRRQHTQILQVCKEIDDLIVSRALLSGNSSNASGCLVRLTGQLKVHLAMEDKVMYPALINHSDPTIADLAKRYQDEMGGLVSVYLAYADKWSTKAIDSDPVEFAAATKIVFAALRDRIDREDNELYPLVDKMGL
jgi:hemerythrin-like domain-containing protein